jgi:flagellar protein FliJ
MIAKKYKFKLESLLKIRQLKEKVEEIELAKISKEINHHKNLLNRYNDEINSMYAYYEEVTQNPDAIKTLQYFPFSIDKKRLSIEEEELKIKELKIKYDEQIKKFNQARGETKIIQNMKEKDFLKHKKLINKKEEEDLEELFRIRKSYNDKNNKGLACKK